MKVVSWNVNGIRARWEVLKQFIISSNIDILGVQECRVNDDSWIENLNNELLLIGYKLIISKHKYSGYAGVGFIVRTEYQVLNQNSILPGRDISILIDGITYTNVYIHQGQEIDSDQFNQKIEYINTLINKLNKNGRRVVLGDFNICPTERDVWNTDYWNDSTVSCTPKERELFWSFLVNLNLKEVEFPQRFSWYSARHNWRLYQDNKRVSTEKYGVKCDHILISHSLNYNCANIDLENGLPEVKSNVTLSDHSPLIVEINSSEDRY